LEAAKLPNSQSKVKFLDFIKNLDGVYLFKWLICGQCLLFGLSQLLSIGRVLFTFLTVSVSIFVANEKPLFSFTFLTVSASITNRKAVFCLLF
jgi:hypothetical protein